MCVCHQLLQRTKPSRLNLKFCPFSSKLPCNVYVNVQPTINNEILPPSMPKMSVQPSTTPLLNTTVTALDPTLPTQDLVIISSIKSFKCCNFTSLFLALEGAQYLPQKEQFVCYYTSQKITNCKTNKQSMVS